MTVVLKQNNRLLDTVFPVEEVIPSLLEGLHQHGAAVLIAEPGAGKTTCVPMALADDSRFAQRNIWVVQPRRIAAISVATYVAGLRLKNVGDEVGYAVRFAKKMTPRTRIRFVTTGVAIQLYGRIRDSGDVVVLDEFHERSPELDALLALCRHNFDRNPVLIMSATMDGAPVAKFLKNCPVVTSEGKKHSVKILYSKPNVDPTRELVSVVSRVYKQALGNILAFLPTVHQIDVCHKRLSGRVGDIRLLHGGLTVQEQRKVIDVPQKGCVILATNVAETSLTIPGIHSVVDAGTRNVATETMWGRKFSIDSITKASAVQRAGRAGRVAAGECYRLYTKAAFEQFIDYDNPGIEQADIGALYLALYAQDTDPTQLSWLHAPREKSVHRATQTLGRLGLVTNGKITMRGRRVAKLPLGLRAGWMVDMARDTSYHYTVTTLAALVDTSFSTYMGALSDLDANFRDPTELVDLLWQNDNSLPWRRRGKQILQKNIHSVCNKARNQHDRSLESERQWLLMAYADRVAKRMSGNTVRLADGSTAILPDSFFTAEEFFLVFEVVENRGKVRVVSALPVKKDELLEHCIEDLQEREIARWNSQTDTVYAEWQARLFGIVIDTDRVTQTGEELRGQMAEVLFEQAKKRPLSFFYGDALQATLGKLALVQQYAENKIDGDISLDTDMPWHVVKELCEVCLSLAEIKDSNPFSVLRQKNREMFHKLDVQCPSTIDLPGRKRVKVQYEQGKSPWISSRIQDFFGLQKTPEIMNGRCPLVVHLLAPNRRAVQVTSDLASFWQNHYPGLQKELKRKYPRHPWPEDPHTHGPK